MKTDLEIIEALLKTGKAVNAKELFVDFSKATRGPTGGFVMRAKWNVSEEDSTSNDA